MPEKDQHLVGRTLAGDRHAFGDLVERYNALVHGLTLEITRRPDAVEDLVQEVFCKAYEELASLRKPERFASWLYAIAANKAQEWNRRQRTRRRVEGVEGLLGLDAVSMTPEAEFEKEEAYAALWEALDRLPPEYRRVLVLHFWEGCSYQSIGGFLGISTTAVRWRALRAQSRLKQNVIGVLRERAEGATRGRKERKERIMSVLPVVAFFRQPAPHSGWVARGWKIVLSLGLVGAAGWFGLTVGTPGFLGRISGEYSGNAVEGFRVKRTEVELPETSVSWTPREPRAGEAVRFEVVGAAASSDGEQLFLHYMLDPRYPVDRVIPLNEDGDARSAEWKVPDDAVTFFFHVSEESEPLEFDPWAASPARKMQLRRYTHVFPVHDGDRKPVRNAAAWQAEMAATVGRPDAEILALWDQEIALHPDNFEAQAHRWLAISGGSWLSIANPDTAATARRRIEAERQALWERYPDRPEAFWWSIVYEVGKRPELYRQMRERFPGYPHLDDLAYLVCASKRDPKERIQAYEELIRFHPGSAYVDDAYQGLLVFLEREDPERAMSLADSILSGALKWEPDPVRERSQRFGDHRLPMTFKGEAYLLRIKKMFQREIPVSSDGNTHQEANEPRANRRYRKEKFEKIWALIRELKDSDLEDFYPYYYVGEQLWAWEDEEDYREIYAAAVDILEAGRPYAYPQHLLTFPSFQRIPPYVPPSAHEQFEQRNFDRARDQSSWYLLLLAQRYLSLDEEVRARECLEEGAVLAEGLSGKFAVKLFALLGDVRQRMGDRKGAKAAYRQVLEISPGHLVEKKLARLIQERPGDEAGARAVVQTAYPEVSGIALTDFRGKAVDLREYRGKVVLVYHDGAAFTGLLSRRLEILREWQRQYAERGLTLLYACGNDRGCRRTRAAGVQQQVAFEILRDDGSVWSGFELEGMSLLLIDRNGRLRLKEGGWIEAMRAEDLGEIARRVEEVIEEAGDDEAVMEEAGIGEGTVEDTRADEETGQDEDAAIRDPAVPERDSPPAAWLEAERLSANRVRFFLSGTRDSEDGLDLQGALDFGDQTDTTFTRVPQYIDHLYADDGTYDIRLRVEDSRGLKAVVSLELSLRRVLRMPRPDVEYERGYKSKPLDR